MHTTYKEIIENQIQYADISATAFGDDSAKFLSDALQTNTSIIKLNLSLSNVNDNDFSLITDALMSREKDLVELNIDGIDITEKSLPDIQRLLTAGKVKSLMMYRIEGVHNNTAVMADLTQLAQQHGASISFDNPLEREEPGYFAHRTRPR